MWLNWLLLRLKTEWENFIPGITKTPTPSQGPSLQAAAGGSSHARFSMRIWQSETNRKIETLSHLRRQYKDTALQSGLGFALPMIYRVCSSILFCILKYVFISLVEELHAWGFMLISVHSRQRVENTCSVSWMAPSVPAWQVWYHSSALLWGGDWRAADKQLGADHTEVQPFWL